MPVRIVMGIESTIGWERALGLFAAMALLAAAPSGSVFLVVARAASSGFLHGALTALGVVLGDIVFILVAAFGLNALAGAPGAILPWIKYLGGAYLIAVGIGFIWSGARSSTNSGVHSSLPCWSSFLSGLALTLGDQKAIFFYLGFLPGFIPLRAFNAADLAVVIGITAVTVGGVKFFYAAFASQALRWLGGAAGIWLTRVAGAITAAVGVCLVLID